MSKRRPDWDELYRIAETQSGYFTSSQAKEAGYSSPLLRKHVVAGRFAHVRRGIYRLVYFPPMENEEFVVLWLWSNFAGVLSHDTALSLYGLSDILPAHAHITLPATWARRRLKLPDGVRAYYADVDDEERSWFGWVPITSPARTLQDCLDAHLPPDLLEQAIYEAFHRGQISSDDFARFDQALVDGLRSAG